MTLTGVRNTLIAVLVVAAAAMVYDATSGEPARHPDERVVEIRYFGLTRFNTAGHFGSIPFSRSNKTEGHVERGAARVGEVVYSHMWYVEGAPRHYIRCQVWQGSTNITDSVARADVHRDYTCWAEVR